MPSQCPSPHSWSWECLTFMVLGQKTMIYTYLFLVRLMESFERPIVLNSFAALGDASLFCCIFGIHDYDTKSMAL
jgi:hypothetical protein